MESIKKQNDKSQVLLVGLFFALIVGLFLSIFGLSKVIDSVDKVAISKTPEAILASAGVSEETGVGLSVAYFDQRADSCVNLYDNNMKKELMTRQFEWTSCKYNRKEIEQGLIGRELGNDYLPIALGGDLIPNRGISDMKRWFTAVEGRSQAYPGAINLTYRAGDPIEFFFKDGDFYPLDGASFSANDAVNEDGHNHLFTMGFAIPFTVMASGDESFEILADDDTFVFLGNELIIDMGGIHEATEGRFAINEEGEIYASILDEELAYSGAKVEKDQDAIIRVFHADRDSSESVFGVKFVGMNLNIVQTQLSKANSNAQIAYDPTDPLSSYAMPLGQNSIKRPDGMKGFIVMIVIEAILVVTFAILIALTTRIMIKRKMTK